MVIWLLLLLALSVVGYLAYMFFAPPAVQTRVAGAQIGKDKKVDSATTEEKKTIRRVQVDAEAMKYGPVPVYFASQTGTAEQLANDLAEEGKDKSILFVPTNIKDLHVLFCLTRYKSCKKHSLLFSCWPLIMKENLRMMR